MDSSTGVATRAIDAYTKACRALPLRGQRGRPGSGISLYGWQLEPKRDVRIPKTPELTVAVHLGGAPRVRVFTESGVSRLCSRPGDITLVPKDRPIHYLIEGGVEFATLHLSGGARRVLGPNADRLLDLPHCLFALRDDYVLASVRALLRASTASDADSRRYTSKVLESLVWHLLRVVSETPVEPVRLADELDGIDRNPRSADLSAILEEIEEQLGEPLSLGKLSAMAGMGRTAFCERFTASVGCSPHRYIVDRRVARARRLLEDGGSSVTDIAYALGFSSASHFSAAFKRATGTSPQAIRRRRVSP
ncbi:MAG TPA: AraC family transcriptional regulator [Nevskiaceae bacterium]|nr:AraC family transcriptional regulator [Nevskiaceae bacterium]